jgi:hypothetical protein
MPRFNAETSELLTDEDLVPDPERMAPVPASTSPSSAAPSPPPSSGPTLTPGQAQMQADAIVAAAAGVSTHPLNDASHPAHAETVHEFLRLNALAAAGTSTAGNNILPDNLPGQTPVGQSVSTGQPVDPADVVWAEGEVVETDGLEADREGQAALRAIGQAFGSAAPERELLEGLKGIHERKVPVLDDAAYRASLEARWTGSGLTDLLRKANWVEDHLPMALAKFPASVVQRLEAAFVRATATAEGMAEIEKYYDRRWATGNDTFSNFVAGVQSALQEAEDKLRAEGRQEAQADADAALAEQMSDVAASHARRSRQSS